MRVAAILRVVHRADAATHPTQPSRRRRPKIQLLPRARGSSGDHPPVKPRTQPLEINNTAHSNRFQKQSRPISPGTQAADTRDVRFTSSGRSESAIAVSQGKKPSVSDPSACWKQIPRASNRTSITSQPMYSLKAAPSRMCIGGCNPVSLCLAFCSIESLAGRTLGWGALWRMRRISEKNRSILIATSEDFSVVRGNGRQSTPVRKGQLRRVTGRDWLATIQARTMCRREYFDSHCFVFRGRFDARSRRTRALCPGSVAGGSVGRLGVGVWRRRRFRRCTRVRSALRRSERSSRTG